jgi:hypothetical protein
MGMLPFRDYSIIDVSTALNKRIDTASLTTPSPNNTELSFLYFSSFIIVNTAILSVAHNTAAYNEGIN